MKTAAVLLALTLSATSFAADAPRSYEGLKSVWEKTRDSLEYQQYAAEFVQYANYYHIDQKGGCYALSPEPVELLMIISKPENDEFAKVEHVLSDVDNAKSRCFQKTYEGLRTRVPLYTPFVLQMQMK